MELPPDGVPEMAEILRERIEEIEKRIQEVPPDNQNDEDLQEDDGEDSPDT